MISTFKNRKTEQAFKGVAVKGFPADLLGVTRRKLRMIHRAMVLEDLRVPPANHLEALKGDRAGQYSIRVNDQFRLCFTWADGTASDVEFTDYH